MILVPTYHAHQLSWPLNSTRTCFQVLFIGLVQTPRFRNYWIFSITKVDKSSTKLEAYISVLCRIAVKPISTLNCLICIDILSKMITLTLRTFVLQRNMSRYKAVEFQSYSLIGQLRMLWAIHSLFSCNFCVSNSDNILVFLFLFLWTLVTMIDMLRSMSTVLLVDRKRAKTRVYGLAVSSQ